MPGDIPPLAERPRCEPMSRASRPKRPRIHHRQIAELPTRRVLIHFCSVISLFSQAHNRRANLAVIISTALPEGVVEFGRVDDVWVAGRRAWPALAMALRE